MARFPENDVEILRVYALSSSLRQTVLANLDKGPAVPTRIGGLNRRVLTENKDATARKKARASLRTLLVNFDKVHRQVDGKPAAIDQSYDLLLKREFALAKTKIEETATAPVGTRFGMRGAILSATARNKLPFTAVRTETIQGKPVVFEVPAEFPGYGGPRLSKSQIDVLEEVGLLLAGGWERRFRISVVQAEAAAGEGDYDEALAVYAELQAIAARLPDHKRKFVALRTAFAHLARGDQLYRRGGTDDPGLAVRHYRDARLVVESAGVSPENPLRQEIFDYADQQEAQVAHGLNYLGYSQQLAPDRPFFFYFERAAKRIRLASQAKDRFEAYLEKAIRHEDVEDELVHEVQTAQDRVVQAELNEEAADERVRKTERNIERIEDSEYFQDIAAGVAVVGAVAVIVAAHRPESQ